VRARQRRVLTTLCCWCDYYLADPADSALAAATSSNGLTTAAADSELDAELYFALGAVRAVTAGLAAATLATGLATARRLAAAIGAGLDAAALGAALSAVPAATAHQKKRPACCNVWRSCSLSSLRALSVLSGKTASGQRFWAILCSQPAASSIVVWRVARDRHAYHDRGSRSAG